jgi:hypothetical protein
MVVVLGQDGLVAITFKYLKGAQPVIGVNPDADHSQFTVREPFPSRVTQVEMVFGQVTRKQPLRLVSQMAGYGVIFSDGIEADFLEFNAGMTATISLAERFGQLVN